MAIFERSYEKKIHIKKATKTYRQPHGLWHRKKIGKNVNQVLLLVTTRER